MLLSVNHLSLSLQTIELTLQLPEQTFRAILLLTGDLAVAKTFPSVCEWGGGGGGGAGGAGIRLRQPRTHTLRIRKWGVGKGAAVFPKSEKSSHALSGKGEPAIVKDR
jgi:hypothetical protein